MLLKFFPIYTAIVLAGCAVTFARAEDTPPTSEVGQIVQDLTLVDCDGTSTRLSQLNDCDAVAIMLEQFRYYA